MEDPGKVFATDCLDEACWLRAHDFKIVEERVVGKIGNKDRVEWVFEDPEGTAMQIAYDLRGTITARTLQERTFLIPKQRNRRRSHHQNPKER